MGWVICLFCIVTCLPDIYLLYCWGETDHIWVAVYRTVIFLFMILSNWVLSCLSSVFTSSDGAVDCGLLSSFIFCSRVFSNCCCCFFLCDEYDIIMPLMTALPDSQSVDGEISGESFISRKDAHFLFIRVVKLWSSMREVLKRHLVEVFFCAGLFNVKDTAAWSLIIIEWIVFSDICWIKELLIKKTNLF